MNDVCVIGAGGIVGAAIARELAQRGISVLGLEKHKTPCRETSGLNSRVIHSGFHERPGTLKADLAREGSRLILEYAGQRRIPLLRTGIAVENSCYRIRAASGEFTSRILINSAGLRAHAISEMAGGPRYNVEFIRGDYYELAGGVERWNIRTLIYPAMPPHSKSKGVHFGPRTDGRLCIGPSATSVDEPSPKRLFLEAAPKFIPDVGEDDLEWAYAGVRPKCGGDFTIRFDRAEPPLINLIGIDSPGLSACMAIARYVARLLRNGRSY